MASHTEHSYVEIHLFLLPSSLKGGLPWGQIGYSQSMKLDIGHTGRAMVEDTVGRWTDLSGLGVRTCMDLMCRIMPRLDHCQLCRSESLIIGASVSAFVNWDDDKAPCSGESPVRLH